MDRNSILRVAIIGLAVLLIWQFGPKLWGGNKDKGQQVTSELYADAPGFAPDDLDPPVTPGQPNKPEDGELCTIKGNRVEAVLSSRGAAIKHLYLRDAKYAEGEGGFDLSTTPERERWRSLRTLLRGPEASDQVKFDRFPWKLEKVEDKACKFTYEDDAVRITKTVSAGARPFEMNVETAVTNLADAPKKHQLTIGTYSYRTNQDIKGSLGRVSPFQTELSCAAGKDVVRKAKDEFKSGWFAVPGTDRYAAVNTHYFTQAIIPEPGEGAIAEAPRCELLAEEWARVPGQSPSDDDAAAVYHAKLVYSPKELAPKASATYRQSAFFGPKERDVLAHAAGGRGKLDDLINLGFFTPVARFLVGVLVFFHDKITFGNWGVAIIVMTICLRLVLFPLTFKSIKTTIAMRRLKPEVDALNEKFKDDAQAKNLAMMELWKKHGVNPLGGCLPQLVQMPVWFAMYTTLQTAVEMYHTKFLWFADLSAPDRFFVMPILLGAFMIIQQRIVPQQGMDPVQAKMMMYIMPAVFTVMMLFLPAALGVYMLTNSVLQIVQQLVLEQIAPQSHKGAIVVKQADNLGKGKARV